MNQAKANEMQYLRLDSAAERVKQLTKGITGANDQLDTDGKLVEC